MSFPLFSRDHLLKNFNAADVDGVMRIEEKNFALFEKHSDLNIGGFKSHLEMFEYAFGKNFLKNIGCGILDIGTGATGVFMLDLLTKTFTPPRIAIDAFEVTAPPRDWQAIVMRGQDINRFGKMFDHVQCIETLEHVLEKDQEEIAGKMKDASRGTCLITCCGLGHHLGEANKKSVERNEFLNYKGQPNIEMLMDLGYSVRLVEAYQILAWAIA